MHAAFKFALGLKPIIKITSMDSAPFDMDLEGSSPNLFGSRAPHGWNSLPFGVRLD